MIRLFRPSFNRSSVKRLSNALRGPVIGINFGFTNSSVAILEDRKAKVLKNDEGSILTPSVVAFTKDDEILVGAPAIRQSVLNSQNTIFGIKRLIGRKYDEKEVQDFMKDIPYKVIKSSNGDAWIETQNNIYSPPQLASFILTKLKKTAENYLNKKVGDAIITVPAYFNDSQRKLIKHACKLANINVIRVFDESNAAAFSYYLYSTTVVINLGGGTFDLSIIKEEDDVYEVIFTYGDSFLGGLDFDNAIVNYLVDEFKRENGIDLTKDQIAMQRLRKAAEKAKCELSSSIKTSIILPYISVDIGGPKHLNMKLSRSKFEELTANLFQRIEEPCKKAMENAEMKSDTFDVLLVGGMTRMPKIQQIVKQIFGKKPYVPEVVTYCDRVVAVKDETTSFRDGTIMDKDGLITCGGICLGVHSGDINFVNGRRVTSKNLAKASQELYYAKRNDCRGLLMESVSYIIKEFYSKIHIDVKSDDAAERLGFFLDRFHKKDLTRYERSSFFDVYDLFIPGARAIDDYYGDPQDVTRELCDSTFKFMKDFPMNNKNLLSVKAALMPYLLGIKNFEKEKNLVRREYTTIKFKRINKNINIRHLLKKYIFKNKQCKRRKQKHQKLLLFETFEEIAVREK